MARLTRGGERSDLWTGNGSKEVGEAALPAVSLESHIADVKWTNAMCKWDLLRGRGQPILTDEVTGKTVGPKKGLTCQSVTLNRLHIAF